MNVFLQNYPPPQFPTRGSSPEGYVDQTSITMGQMIGLPLPGSGGSAPDLNLAPAETNFSLPSASTFIPGLLAETVYAGKETAEIAKTGADLAGIQQNTEKIPAPSGKAAFRVPDQLDQNSVREVKLVDKLHFSSQIKDILAYAQKAQVPFTLYVRGEENATKLTAPLQ